MRVAVRGIGLCGPGLPDWPAGQAALGGAYQPSDTIIPAAELLPATERRRTVPIVRLALAVGSQAVRQAGADAGDLATVFASSGGDGETVHAILETLASTSREVSPTRFHNSVHNAPSGYWNIATGSRAPTTSLCAYDDSFAAGLLETAAQVHETGEPVLLVAYDVPYPAPLAAVRRIVAPFGMALLLAPADTAGMAALTLELRQTDQPPAPMGDPALETLRLGNPAARSLGLLAALAKRQASTIVLESRGSRRLVIAVEPVE